MGFALEQFVKPPHSEFICGVCADVLAQPVETVCGHLFCSECLSIWFQARKERLCPNCRAAVTQVKSARVISNIIGDLGIRCTGSEAGCSWEGKVSQLYRHQEECAHCALVSKPASQNTSIFAALRTPEQPAEPENDREDSNLSAWLRLFFSLVLAMLAGRQVAMHDIVRMWAMMVFCLLCVLEPGTSMPVLCSSLFLLVDAAQRFAGPSLAICIPAWVIAVTPAIGTIRISTQRPIPPQLIVTVGDVPYAMPGYYHIALTVISGALGYYHAVADNHKYIVAGAALVIAVLLPSAVRLYRRRLPLDDLPVWRHGIDDLSLLYLCTSILSGTEFFAYCVFPAGSFMYQLMSLMTTFASVGLALLAVTEACLLGSATRYQVIGTALPLLMLGIACPQ